MLASYVLPSFKQLPISAHSKNNEYNMVRASRNNIIYVK